MTSVYRITLPQKINRFVNNKFKGFEGTISGPSTETTLDSLY